MFHRLIITPMNVLLCLALVLLACSAHAQHGRVTFADIFTNSHCGPCASMHEAVDRHITRTPRADNVIVVYHHIRVYADDPIYQANQVDPTERARYYTQVQGTPTVFFNGVRWNGAYADWPQHLDGLPATSPVGVSLQPLVTADSVIVTVTVNTSEVLPSTSLYVGIVEDVTYRGRNGVEDHRGVLRAAFTPASGISIDAQPAAASVQRLAIARRSLWDLSKCRVVAAVSDIAMKSVQQAAQVAVQGPSRVGDVTDMDVAAEAQWFSLGGVPVFAPRAALPVAEIVRAGLPSSIPSGLYMLYVRTVTGTAGWRTIIHLR